MTQDKLLPLRLDRQVNTESYSFLEPEKKTLNTSCGLLVMLLDQCKFTAITDVVFDGGSCEWFGGVGAMHLWGNLCTFTSVLL